MREMCYVMSPKHTIVDYGRVWIRAHVACCMHACEGARARACAAVRAHTCATCLPALHALLLSLLLRRRDEREGVCIPKKIILPSRPSSAAFRLHPPLPVHLPPPSPPRRCEMCARSLKEGSQQHGGLSPLVNQNIASRDPVSSRNGAVAHKAFTLSVIAHRGNV